MRRGTALAPVAAPLLADAAVQQIVNAFRAQRAVSIALAQPLRDLRLNDSRSLRQMVVETIIRRAGPERYYLDEGVLASRRQMGGRTAVRALVVVAIIALAAVLFLYGR
jgi:hypothetical protein